MGEQLAADVELLDLLPRLLLQHLCLPRLVGISEEPSQVVVPVLVHQDPGNHPLSLIAGQWPSVDSHELLEKLNPGEWELLGGQRHNAHFLERFCHSTTEASPTLVFTSTSPAEVSSTGAGHVVAPVGLLPTCVAFRARSNLHRVLEQVEGCHLLGKPSVLVHLGARGGLVWL